MKRKTNEKTNIEKQKFNVLRFIKKLYEWFNYHRVVTYLIDCLILFGLFVAIFLEDKGAVPYFSNHNLTLDIIISLLPAVATIISVSMQMQNEKIRGISVRDFNRLRRGAYFTLLHMLIIILTIFVLETILIFYSFEFALIILDAISVVYSLIFLVEEIPVLMQHDYSINRVLKKYVLKDATFVPLQQANYNICLTHSTVINTCPFFFRKVKFKSKKKNERLLINLLSYQYQYFEQISKQTKSIRSLLSLYGIDFFKAFSNSFNDINYLLDIKNKPNINYISEKNYGIFNLTRLTYMLYKVANNTGYTSLFEENINQLINQLYLATYGGQVEKNKLIYQYLLAMSVSTLKVGETWFVKAIRDRSFAPLFFDINESPLTFLITMYMCFIIHSSVYDADSKKLIESFLNESSTGLNSEGYKWKEKIKDSLRNLNNGKHFLEGVLKILKLKQYLDDVQYEIIPKYGGVYTVDDSTHFGNELVLEYCLEVLLFNYFYDLSRGDVIDFIEKLTENDKKSLRHLVETKWLENSFNTVFYQFIFDKKPNINLANTTILNALKDYTFKENKKNYSKEDDGDLDSDLIEMQNRLNNKIREIIDKTLLIKEQKTIKQAKKQYFGILVDGFDRLALFDRYLDQLSASFNNIIKKEIESNIKPTFVQGFAYNEEMINEIIKFKPYYYSNSYRLDFNSTNLQKEKIAKFIEIDDGSIPLDMFLKKDAIVAKFKYHESLSKPRRLKRREIEGIIDRDYTMTNGYYRFNKYKGSQVGNFFVTKDELVELLQKRMVFIPIVFTLKVEYKNSDEKIKYFTFKE